MLVCVALNQTEGPSCAPVPHAGEEGWSHGVRQQVHPKGKSVPEPLSLNTCWGGWRWSSRWPLLLTPTEALGNNAVTVHRPRSMCPLGPSAFPVLSHLLWSSTP